MLCRLCRQIRSDKVNLYVLTRWGSVSFFSCFHSQLYIWEQGSLCVCVCLCLHLLLQNLFHFLWPTLYSRICTRLTAFVYIPTLAIKSMAPLRPKTNKRKEKLYRKLFFVESHFVCRCIQLPLNEHSIRYGVGILYIFH